LQPVKLEGLDPDSLWAGPPARALELLFFFCFFSLAGRALQRAQRLIV